MGEGLITMIRLVVVAEKKPAVVVFTRKNIYLMDLYHFPPLCSMLNAHYNIADDSNN